VKRCAGKNAGGDFTSFDCALDEGHPGRCVAYQPPTVDQWREQVAVGMLMAARIRELEALVAASVDAVCPMCGG